MDDLSLMSFGAAVFFTACSGVYVYVRGESSSAAAPCRPAPQGVAPTAQLHPQPQRTATRTP